MSDVTGTKKRILLVAGDAHFRGMLRNFLARYFAVDEAATAEQGLQLVSRGNPHDLAVVDMDLQHKGGLGFAAAARLALPGIKVLLLTAFQLEDHFAHLRRNRLYNVVIRGTPFDFDDFLLSVENLLFPERAFGLRRYLRDPMLFHQRAITSQAEKTDVVDEAILFFRNYRPYEDEVTEMRLAFEEMINNAVYHGFRRRDGSERYLPGSFGAMDLGDRIEVEYGRDNTYLGCCVSDNQGCLNVDEVLGKMERQISLEGVMDESGRGIYLSRSLCDKMVINLNVGQVTQFILLWANRREVRRHKPLMVHVVEAPRAVVGLKYTVSGQLE